MRSDIDDVIASNLKCENRLVQSFTMAELVKILKPYTLLNRLPGFDTNFFKSLYKDNTQFNERLKSPKT